MAASSTQGMLVAPSTKMPSLLFPTPTKPERFSQNEHFLHPLMSLLGKTVCTQWKISTVYCMYYIHCRYFSLCVIIVHQFECSQTPSAHPAFEPGTPSWCGGRPHSHSHSWSRTASPPRQWRWLKVCAGEPGQTGSSPAWETQEETDRMRLHIHKHILLHCFTATSFQTDIPCLSFSKIQVFQTNTHTSHSLPATWTWGLRRRQRRRWSCWPRWPRPWPGMTSQSLEDQTAGCLSTESACLKTQRPRSNVGQTELVFNSLF